ncbi:hypothetical protein [Methyloprofundus sp.]|uniref:hypothetical protein n=1 Tax=Methyloprofundus sp. TaxID=2020875 RepID=UPI003D09C302
MRNTDKAIKQIKLIWALPFVFTMQGLKNSPFLSVGRGFSPPYSTFSDYWRAKATPYAQRISKVSRGSQFDFIANLTITGLVQQTVQFVASRSAKPRTDLIR